MELQFTCGNICCTDFSARCHQLSIQQQLTIIRQRFDSYRSKLITIRITELPKVRSCEGISGILTRNDRIISGFWCAIAGITAADDCNRCGGDAVTIRSNIGPFTSREIQGIAILVFNGISEVFMHHLAWIQISCSGVTELTILVNRQRAIGQGNCRLAITVKGQWLAIHLNNGNAVAIWI